MSINGDDPRLAEAIEMFNQQDFFACHDVLEEIWSETLSEERVFLQGLIHATVALFHYTEGNLGGARKMHDSAVGYLSPYQPSCLNIEVTQFLQNFDACFAPLLGQHDTYPESVAVDESLIPQLAICD